MHIAFVSPESPVSATGGISSYLQVLVPELLHQGHRVTVLAFAAQATPQGTWWNGARYVAVRPPPIHWYVNKLPSASRIITLPMRQIEWSVAFARQLRRAISEDPPDVIEATETGSLLLRSVTSAPLVIRLHGSDYLFRVHTGEPLHAAARLNHMLERHTRRGATLVTVPSHFMAEQVCHEEGWDPGAVCVIPNPVDMIFTNAVSPGTTAGEGGSAPMVLYTGRLARVKGTLVLIQAAEIVRRAVPEARFVLAGPDQLEPRDRAALRAADVDYVGVVDRDRLAELYRAADIFVMPSYVESFGISVVEAMSAGLAVVVSDVGALRELITPEETGMVVPAGDSVALAAVLIRLLRNPALRRNLGQRAREDALSRFSAPVIASHMVEAYAAARRLHALRT